MKTTTSLLGTAAFVTLTSSALLIHPNLNASTGVTSGATSGFRNPADTSGMCTPDNKEQEFYQVGYCKAIFEKIVKDGCTKKYIEELRLRTLQDPKQKGWKELKNKTPFDYFECNSKVEKPEDKPKHTMAELAKDPEKYAEFMMQFFSLVTINESDWDAKLKRTPGGNEGKGDSAQGIMNLTRSKTDDKKHECSCKTDDTTDGKSPGPQDPNYSLTCGVGMGLEAMDEDNMAYGHNLTAAEKNKKAGKKDKVEEWVGAAKVFPSLQNTKVGEESPQSKMVREKLAKYCEKYAFNGGMAPVEQDIKQDLGSQSDTSARNEIDLPKKETEKKAEIAKAQ